MEKLKYVNFIKQNPASQVPGRFEWLGYIKKSHAYEPVRLDYVTQSISHICIFYLYKLSRPICSICTARNVIMTQFYL